MVVAPQDLAEYATPAAPPVDNGRPKKRAPRKGGKKQTERLTDTSPEHVLDTMRVLTPEGPLPLPGPAAHRQLAYPDSGYIQDRVSERATLYGGGGGGASPQAWQIPETYDAIVESVRARRKGQVKSIVPASYAKTAKDVRVGLIDDVISVVASTLNNGERKFGVVKDDETQDEQDRAAKIKRWVTAFVLGSNGRPSRLEEEAGEPWIDLGIEQACADGKGIWEVCLREELWSTAYGYPVESAYEDDPEPVRAMSGVSGYDDEAAEKAYQKALKERKTARQKYLRATDKFTKHAPSPIQVNRVDPLSYCDWRINGKPFEAIKIERRSVRDVYPIYGLWREGASLSGNTFEGKTYARSLLPPPEGAEYVVGDPYPVNQLPPVAGQMQATCITFWKAAPELMNQRGEIPVVWVYEIDGARVACGSTIGPSWHPLPFFPFHGMHTSIPDPAFKGVSIAYRLLGLVDGLNTLLSMKLNVAALFSMASWKWTKPENGQFDINTGGAGAAAASGVQAAQSSFGGTSTFEPAVIYHLGPGEDIQPIVPPPGAIAVLDSLKEDLMEFINLVGLPAALRGVSPGSGSAGYMVAQLIAAARTKLAPILKNAASAIVQLIKYILWKVEHHFEEGVPVQESGEWLTLTPADVDGRYLCELEIEPLLPVDRAQAEEHGLKMHAAGVYSMRYLQEKVVGLESGSEMDEELEAERIRRHPLLALPRAIDAAVRLGRITPEEGRAIKSKEFGIPYNSPAAAVGAGIIVGPDGRPIVPGAPPPVPPTATPGIPPVPSVPPIAPVPPDTSGAVGSAQIQGGIGVNGGQPQRQPDRAAAAVGS